MERSSVIIRRVAAVLAVVIVVSYTIFHIVSLFSAEIPTIVVAPSTEQTRIGFDGYIFRDEKLVLSDNRGAVEYAVNDGLKVSANQTLAYVYERGNDADVSERLLVIDREIKVIREALAANESLTDLPKLNQSVAQSHTDIMKKLAEGDLRGIRSDIDSMTAEMGKVISVTDKNSFLSSTLASLVEEREHIISAGGSKQEIKSDRSGYFYSGVDGYEGVFTIDAADSMTPESYLSYVTSSPSESGAIGKMTYDSEWRFASLVNERDAEYFTEGVTYDLVFTGNGDVRFPLTLIKKTADADSENVLLVFFCDRAPSSFSFERFQSVEAVVETVSGIKVPKSATHRSGGKLYVYILKGSVVLERRIEVTYEGSDYYMVADGAYIESEGDEHFLCSNDTLIIGGNNLFDGRILE